MRSGWLRFWPAVIAAGIGLSIALFSSSSESPAQPPAAPQPVNDPPPPQGVDIQTRGPVHEAFATPTAEHQATTPVTKAPPKPLDEMPPEEKPEGNAVWIGGYWAWDDERKDYLWVSGTWRVPPPSKNWVAGYWREDADKWQWVPGFWAEAQQQAIEKHDVTYMPKPPEPPQTAPPGPAPNTDSFYVPGQWVWRGDAYAWQAGYWARVQPGYVWVPAHFRWTPYGFVFIPGYWDLAIASRGVLYAPVVVEPVVVVYTPCYVVHHTVVIDAFFVRPCYCHYYYGDYYGPAYRDCGYTSVFVYSRSHYDSVVVYERWDHRADPRWETTQVNIVIERDAGRAPCPPRTIVEYNRYGRERGLVVAPAARVAEMHGTRMVRMDAGERARVQEHAQAVRQVAAERRVSEAKLTAGPPQKPQAASVAMPKGYTAAHAAPARSVAPNTTAPAGRGSAPAPQHPGAPNSPTTPGKPTTPSKPPPGKPMPPKPPPPKSPPPKGKDSDKGHQP
jgi:hypothetical protein